MSGQVPPPPQAGDVRRAAAFARCSSDTDGGCIRDATLEVLHAPGNDGSRVWVPLCPGHVEHIKAGKALGYVVEVHGFVPGRRP